MKNILVILSDEQRLDTLGCYGNHKISTPNIDSLAAQGVRFTNCNVTYPLCCPSRTSLFTGLRPDQHGVMENWRPIIPEEADGRLIRQFAKQGYTTAYIGKWHVPGTTPRRMGFSRADAIPAIVNGKDRGRTIPEYRDYLRDKGYAVDDIDLENLVTEESSRLEIPNKAPVATSRYKKEDYLEFWLLERWKRQMDGIDGPFFSVCSYVAPHFPMVIPAPYDSMYSPEDVTFPDNFRTGLSGKPDMLFEKHYYREPLNLSEYEWRRMVAYYWGFCTMVDDIVGEMIDYLKERGFYDDTVICYSTDHGDMMGSHGLWEKGFPMLYEETNRVPLIIKVPDSDIPVVDGLMSMTDILPTLATLAGCKLDTTGLDIRSYANSADGRESRAYHIAEAFELGGGYRTTGRPGGIPITASDLRYENDLAAISIKTERYKYILHTHDRDELYDLQTDPLENVNLAGDTAMKEVYIEMQSALLGAIADNPPFHKFIKDAITCKINNPT